MHAKEGYHYKCRHSGALDVNADNGPGTEKQLIDGIVGQVQKLGFRTIWQAAGHFDHIHIDVANSGAIGAGGGDGGAVGALEETGLDVKLIDWEAEYTPFGGFGGLASGGFYGGPPNMQIAQIICDVLDRYGNRGAGRACGCPRSRPRSSSPACTTSPTAIATRSACSSSARGRGPGAPQRRS